MPRNVQSTLHVWIILILSTTPWSQYYYLHFSPEETEADKGLDTSLSSHS